MINLPSIGKMDRKIIIQQPTVTRTASGSAVHDWEAIHVLWAMVTETTGNESEKDDKITAFEKITFTTRYTAGINQRMRVSYDGNTYKIISVQREHRRKYLIIKTVRND